MIMIITTTVLKNKLLDLINKKISCDELKEWSLEAISSDNIEFEENTCVSDIIYFLDDDFLENKKVLNYSIKFIELIDDKGEYDDFKKIISI
jgi:hypothetical protein